MTKDKKGSFQLYRIVINKGGPLLNTIIMYLLQLVAAKPLLCHLNVFVTSSRCCPTCSRRCRRVCLLWYHAPQVDFYCLAFENSEGFIMYVGFVGARWANNSNGGIVNGQFLVLLESFAQGV